MIFTFTVRKKQLSCGLWIEMRSLQRNPLTRLEIYMKVLKRKWFARGRRGKCFLLEIFEFYWESLWSFTHVWFIYKIVRTCIKVFWWSKPLSCYYISLCAVPNTVKAGTYKYMLHLIYVGILTSVFSFCSISQMCHMSKKYKTRGIWGAIESWGYGEQCFVCKKSKYLGEYTEITICAVRMSYIINCILKIGDDCWVKLQR